MKNYNTKTESMLIADLKQGSYAAFNGIYEQYARRLFAYCLQYTKSTTDAEDLVQEVFINLWKKRDMIRQEDTLEGLLFTMARFKLINAFRARVNSPVCESYMEYLHNLPEKENHSWIEYRDFMRIFTRLLMKLPVTQRNVIQLSRFRNMTNKQIAERLSLSEQTVKNQLSLGLKTLRDQISRIAIMIYILF